MGLLHEETRREKIRVELSDRGFEIVERGIQEPKKQAVHWNYLFLFGGIGTSIVIPLVLGILVGRYFDARFESGKLFTSIGLGIGFILSLVQVGTTIQSFLRLQKRHT